MLSGVAFPIKLTNRVWQRKNLEETFGDVEMKILYLYHLLKANGIGYHRSEQLTNLMQEEYEVDLKYCILPDEAYDRFQKSDPSYPELLDVRTFIQSDYDAVILDGELGLYGDFPRIPKDTLKSFYDAGGITLFFFNDIDNISHILNDEAGLDDLRSYLASCHHAHGGLFSHDPSVKLIKGAQGRSKLLEIEVDDAYLNRMSSHVRKGIYRDIKNLVADQALHLNMGSEWICIGDSSTKMLDDNDFFWTSSSPLIFGNLSTGIGATCFLTGNLWADYVNEKYPSDNIKFIMSIISFLGEFQKKQGFRELAKGKAKNLNNVHQDTEYDVFLSYSHNDENAMKQIYDVFDSAGLLVWIDKTGITPGTPSWSRAIENALDKSKCIVVIFSPDAKKSDWVEEELNYADAQGKDIYPILVRGDERNAVPFGYSRRQRVDLKGVSDSTYKERLEELIKVLKDVL